MKKAAQLFLLALSLLYYTHAQAQAGNWQWAVTSVEVTPPITFTDQGWSIAADQDGNSYITGFFFSPTITFGTTTLTNAGTNTQDIFIAKYDTYGNFKWAKSAGGNFYDEPFSIATDAFDNVYITGFFRSSSITFGTTTFSSAGGADMFLVKYDSSGNVLWAKTATDNAGDVPAAVTTDPAGNVYVTGTYSGASIAFDTAVVTNNNTGSQDIFLAKYDTNGNIIWAKSAGGDNYDQVKGVTTDPAGNVYLTGSFVSSTILFDTVALLNADAAGAMGDIFTAKYDPAGNVMWAKSAGGAYGDGGNSIATDASGVYMVGEFTSPAINFGTIPLINNGADAHSNLFIVKYDYNGNVLWAKSAGGANSNTASSVATDSTGVYITGFSNDSSLTLDAISLAFPGQYATMIIAKYNSNGNILCATALENKISTQESGVATDKRGNAYFCSNYNASPFEIGATSFSPYDAAGWSQEIFTAKYNCDVTSNSVTEITDEQTISIYPNPATTSVTIKTGGTKIKEIKITDILGKEIMNNKLLIMNDSYTVEMAGVAKGVYFVQVVDDKRNLITKKIIIQ